MKDLCHEVQYRNNFALLAANSQAIAWKSEQLYLGWIQVSSNLFCAWALPSHAKCSLLTVSLALNLIHSQDHSSPFLSLSSAVSLSPQHAFFLPAAAPPSTTSPTAVGAPPPPAYPTACAPHPCFAAGSPHPRTHLRSGKLVGREGTGQVGVIEVQAAANERRAGDGGVRGAKKLGRCRGAADSKAPTSATGPAPPAARTRPWWGPARGGGLALLHLQAVVALAAVKPTPASSATSSIALST